MTNHLRQIIVAPLVLGLLAVPQRSRAQVEPYNFKFNSGQSIQPIFEGWSRNPDGSFDMHFGYLNRNYVDQPSIPVGPENNIEPGGPDRGQPTFFYNRINRNTFVVTVPKDWGKRELVWTVTANGKTEKAIGWLHPEWEADALNPASGSGRREGEALQNKPPSLVVEPVRAVTLPASLTLTAGVTDDGLPKPRGRGKPAVGQETPPTLQGNPPAPVNVPQVAGRGRGAGAATRRGPIEGVSVSWLVWRGPAGVEFQPDSVLVKDGKAVVTATFTQPGSYVLRARATDGMLTSQQDIRLTVNGTASPSQR
jgi:hypothetical protein